MHNLHYFGFYSFVLKLMQKDCDKLFLRSHDLRKVSSVVDPEIIDSNKELRKGGVYSNSDLRTNT